MPSCPWPNCDYEGKEKEHLRQHLEAKHDGVKPSTKATKTEGEKKVDPTTAAIAIATVGIAVILGSFQRLRMGTTDMLQKFDPYEHFHLARHWFNNGEYMKHDALLFPKASGVNPTVGYPPLTHFEPAAITQFLISLGYDVGLVEVMAHLPVVIMALTTVAMFFLGKEIYDVKAGAIAALLTATFPPFIEVGRAGAYDTNLFLFFFTILTLALVARSLNQTVRRDRLYWGALAGISLGLYALHWRGYVMLAGFLGLGIILYTGIGSIVDRLEPDATYSFIGLLAAVPIMSFWYLDRPREIYVVTAVGLLALLPLIAHRFPDFVEERFGLRNGRNIRRYASAVALLAVAFTVYYAVQFGRLPGGIGVPGIGMFDTSGSYQMTIAELQSAFSNGNPLKNSFGMLGELVLPVAGLPVVFIGYRIWKDFHPKRFLELTFVLLTFLMMFEAARFVEPYVVIMTLTLGGMFAWTLDFAGLKEFRETMEAVPFARVTAVAVVLVLLTSPAMPMVAAGGPSKLPSYGPAISYESNGAWLDTYQHMADDPAFNESTAVMSWWDYGFPAKAISEVQYVSDNTQVNIDIPAKFYVMQDLDEGRKFLTQDLKEQRGEDVEYVIGNKYLGYSGKWHAVVTVASTETDMGTPNLFDDVREPGEGDWTVQGSQTVRTNYYRLSFYNASRYGVGDEPYPGYTIVYQSPQWYVNSDGRLALAQKSQIDQLNLPDSQVIGPAITIYEMEK